MYKGLIGTRIFSGSGHEMAKIYELRRFLSQLWQPETGMILIFQNL
jgi:hypothetical protein